MSVVSKRPRSDCSVFVSIRFCCIEATCSHCSVFVQKRREKPPFLCVHTDLRDNKYAAQTSVFVGSHCSVFVKPIVEYWGCFQEPPFLYVHIDSERCQKPLFLWISTFDSVFENLRFCRVSVQISVNTFTKNGSFSLHFCTKTV